MRQQTGKVTAQLKLKTLNDNPYGKISPDSSERKYKHFQNEYQIGTRFS